jgi:gliding motility-associated-like protein
VPVLSGPNAVCENTLVNFSARFAAGANYVWTVTGGNIIATLNDTLIQVRWGAAGTGTVSVRQTNTFGCDSTITKNITIHGRPIASITGDTNICERNMRQYYTNSTNNATYNWNVVNGSVVSASDTVITINWPTSGLGLIQLVKTNQFGCDTSAALPTVILPRPQPFINGANEVCRYKNSTYTTQSRPQHTYKWFVNGGAIMGTDTDTLFRVNWIAPALGKVILIITNELGCDTVEIKDITINPTPTPVITGSNATCANKQYTYSTAFISGNIYNWTVIGGNINTNRDSIIYVTWKDTTAGVVTLRITNMHGCDSVVSLPVVITPTPVALIAGGNTVCAYRTETYTASTVNVTKYKWTVNNGVIVGVDSNAIVNIRWSNQPTGQVTLRVISVAGCDSSITFNVTIRPSPIPEIIGPDSVCQNTAYWYRSAYTPTNNYIWTCSGGSIISNNDSAILVRWGNAGVGMIRLLEATLLGCDSLDFIDVTIINKPTPVVVGPQSLCEKTKGVYTVKKAASTLWQSNGGVINNINDTTIEINWNNAGNFIVFVTQRNSFGCDTVVSLPVTVNPKPSVNIIGPNDVCQYSTHKWYTQRNGITYQWNISGGNIISASNDTVVTAKMGNQPFAALQLRVVNNFGCDTTVYKNITLRNAPSAPITGDSIVCNNVTSYTYSTVAEINHNYLWQVTNGLILNNNNESNAFVNWNKTGFNTVSLYVINNSTGCDTTLYKNVYVDSIVKPNIDLSRAFGCVPFLVSFAANNTDGLGYQYRWNFGNGNTGTIAKQNITYQTAGNFNIQLIVTNKNGCKDTATTVVVGNKRPLASADYVRTGDRIYVEEDTVQFINNSVGGNRYIWDIVGIKTDTTFETASSFVTPGKYRIKLVAKDTLTGCEDSTFLTIDVRVRENVHIPNAFTPNGDGSNDFFKIGIENITAFEIIIANRWGEIIFTSTDPRFEWDGTFKGQPCQTDTYVYLLNATGFHGKNFSIKGNVTLLR